MTRTTIEVMAALCAVTQSLPVGTNLALLQFLRRWTCPNTPMMPMPCSSSVGFLDDVYTHKDAFRSGLSDSGRVRSAVAT